MSIIRFLEATTPEWTPVYCALIIVGAYALVRWQINRDRKTDERNDR